jgi:copper chaperone CopZ
MRSSIWNGVALAAGVVLLAVLGPLLAREVRSLPRPRQLAARADARIATLDIGGMHCSGCATGIRRELETVPGVSAVEVRLETGRAIVVCDRAVADSALVSAVQRAGPGFTAGPARN